MGALDCAPGGEVVPFNVVAFCHANTLSGRKSGKLSLSKVGDYIPKVEVSSTQVQVHSGIWEVCQIPGASLASRSPL